MRWKEGTGCYSHDIDCIEFDIVDGRIRPLAIIEATNARNLDAPGLLDAIWKRLDPDGDGDSRWQTQTMRIFGVLLGLPAVVVVWEDGDRRCAARYIDRDDSKWFVMPAARWLSFLEGLRR